jgi:hypothetical protein
MKKLILGITKALLIVIIGGSSLLTIMTLEAANFKKTNLKALFIEILISLISIFLFVRLLKKEKINLRSITLMVLGTVLLLAVTFFAFALLSSSHHMSMKVSLEYSFLLLFFFILISYLFIPR